MDTPDRSTKVVHLALIVGHGNLLPADPVTYVLRFWCRQKPQPGDTVTTAHADANCPECLGKVIETQARLTREMGLTFTSTSWGSLNELS